MIKNRKIRKRRNEKRKKAFFLGFYVDLWGWLLFFVGMFVWFWIISFSDVNASSELGVIDNDLNDKSILVNIMQTQVTENTNLLDEIIIAAINDDDSVNEVIDRTIIAGYGQSCWDLAYYDDDTGSKYFRNCVISGDTEQMLHQTIDFPVSASGVKGKITLRIRAYDPNLVFAND
jgi:hypothetical protein